MPQPDFLTLAQLAVGDRAEVVRYHSDDDYTQNLMRLGLIPGTQLELVRRAPLGDPSEIRFRGFSLAIRPAEALALELKRA